MKTQQLTDNLNTGIPKIQEQILNFVNSYGSVVQKILFINCESKSKSFLEKNVRKLEEKDLVETEFKGNNKNIQITDKGRRKIES